MPHVTRIKFWTPLGFAAPLVLPLAWATACSGSIESSRSESPNCQGPTCGSETDDVDKPIGLAPPADLVVAPGRIRRLTTVEIENAARDVFLNGSRKSMSLSDIVTGHGFDTNFEALSVNQRFAEALQGFAETVSAEVVKNLSSTPACENQSDATACARGFLTTYGRRAFRRPLTSDEMDSLMQSFNETQKAAGATEGMRGLVEALMQSPHFLFRTEYGRTTSKTARLDRFELASALAFFFWSAPPDDKLLDAAEAQELENEAGFERWIQTLLADPRAKDGMRHFLQQWMEVKPTLLRGDPDFGDDLVPAMVAENEAFIASVLDGDDTLSALFTRGDGFANDTLAKLYGLNGVGSKQVVPVKFADKTRAGFLTQAAFLRGHLGPNFSPVHLGRYIRSTVMCQTLPDPPPVPPVDPPGPNVSTRERFAAHEKEPACASCHILMDRIGFAFERYDSLGRIHETENGKPLTGRGEIVESDVEGFVNGPVELAARLSGSEQVNECFVQRMMEFALGRAYGTGDNTADNLAVQSAKHAAKGDDSLSVKAVAAAIARSHSFQLRNTTSTN